MTDLVPFIETRGLGKTFPDGNVIALDNVSLVIHRNEYVAIMGPSGSGKSTLLALLGALDLPTSGCVYFRGRPLTDYGSLDRFRSQEIGFVFQSFLLLPTLTAWENVQVPMFEGLLSRRQRMDRARHLLEQVGLTHRLNHLPSQLSIGERQRVAIARALANEPALLLADEPTGNLDSKATDDILHLFADLHARHEVTLVVITHSPHVADQAQRTIYMHDGRAVPAREVDMARCDARPVDPSRTAI